MQDKGEVRLRLRSQHTCGGEAVVVDEGRVIAAHPLHRVGRIGDDGVEGLVLTKVGFGQGVAQLHVELIVVHIVQEHVHASQVEGRVVDLLTKEAVLNEVVISSELFRLLLRLQQK